MRLTPSLIYQFHHVIVPTTPFVDFFIRHKLFYHCPLVTKKPDKQEQKPYIKPHKLFLLSRLTCGIKLLPIEIRVILLENIRYLGFNNSQSVQFITGENTSIHSYHFCKLHIIFFSHIISPFVSKLVTKTLSC